MYTLQEEQEHLSRLLSCPDLADFQTQLNIFFDASLPQISTLNQLANLLQANDSVYAKDALNALTIKVAQAIYAYANSVDNLKEQSQVQATLLEFLIERRNVILFCRQLEVTLISPRDRSYLLSIAMESFAASEKANKIKIMNSFLLSTVQEEGLDLETIFLLVENENFFDFLEEKNIVFLFKKLAKRIQENPELLSLEQIADLDERAAKKSLPRLSDMVENFKRTKKRLFDEFLQETVQELEDNSEFIAQHGVIDIETALLEFAFEEEISEENVNSFLTSLAPSATQLITVASQIEEYNPKLADIYQKFARKIENQGNPLDYSGSAPQEWIISSPNDHDLDFENSFDRSDIRNIFDILLKQEELNPVMHEFSEKLTLSSPPSYFLADLLQEATPNKNYFLTQYLLNYIYTKICYSNMKEEGQTLLVKALVDSFFLLSSMDIDENKFDVSDYFDFSTILKFLKNRTELLKYTLQKTSLKAEKLLTIRKYFLSAVSHADDATIMHILENYPQDLDAITYIKGILKVNTAAVKDRIRNQDVDEWKKSFYSLFFTAIHRKLLNLDTTLLTKTQKIIFLEIAVQCSLNQEIIADIIKSTITSLSVESWKDIQSYLKRNQPEILKELAEICNDPEPNKFSSAKEIMFSNASNKIWQVFSDIVEPQCRYSKLYQLLFPQKDELDNETLYGLIISLNLSSQEVMTTAQEFYGHPISDQLKMIALTMPEQIFINSRRKNPPVELQNQFSGIYYIPHSEITFIQKEKIQLIKNDGEIILSVFADPVDNFVHKPSEAIQTQISNCLSCLKRTVMTKDEMSTYKTDLLNSLIILKLVFKDNNVEANTLDVLDKFCLRVEEEIEVAFDKPSINRESILHM